MKSTIHRMQKGGLFGTFLLLTSCNSNMQVHTKDAPPPSVASDTSSENGVNSTTQSTSTIYANSAINLVAPLQGAVGYKWEQISGTNSVTFATPDAAKTEVSASSDGEYEIQVTMSFASASLKESHEKDDDKTSGLKLIWDTTPPVFTEMKAINEAADLEISAEEVGSDKPAVKMIAADFDTVKFSGFLDAALAVTCDGTKNYLHEEAPHVSEVPASNGPYVICARLADQAGNVAYGQSKVIFRNVLNQPSAPVNFAATFNGNRITLGWSAGSANTEGYILVRGDAVNNYHPTDGVAYWAGFSDGSVDIISAGSAISVEDLTLVSLVNYYAVFAYNSEYIYSPASFTSSVTGQPLPAGVVTLINEATDGVLNYAEVTSNSPAASASSPLFNQFTYSGFLNSGAICNATQTYGASPAISTVPGTNGNYVICVRAEDAAGHVVYGASPAISRNVAAQTPSNFAVTPTLNINTISWTSVGNEPEYMLVRSPSAITFSPTAGTTYTAGTQIDANQVILAVGASLQYVDSCFSAASYNYAVYSVNADHTYSTPALASVTNNLTSSMSLAMRAGGNENSCITGPSDLSLMANSNVQLSIRNDTANIMKYEFDVSSTLNFAVKTTYTANNVAAGATSSTLVPSNTLTHGNVYWWRMRYAKEGTSNWSNYSVSRSFRIDNTQIGIGWHLGSYDQMNSVPSSNISNLTLASSNNGELYIASGQTVGTYKSPVINISSFGWSQLGMALATWYTMAPNGANNQYTFLIEYFDSNTSTWTLIPSATYPGNAGNGSMIHANLDAIDPSIYSVIRLSVRLWRDSVGQSTPKCFNLTLEPRTASQGSNFVNGGFENANSGEWRVIRSGDGNEPAVDLAKADGTAHSGTKYAYINHLLTGYGTSREAYVYQTITVPVTATSLTFWRKYYRDAWGAVFRFFVNDTLKETLVSSVTTWNQFTYDMTPYQGQTITFSFGVYDYYWAGAGDHGAWMGVDDISVQ